MSHSGKASTGPGDLTAASDFVGEGAVAQFRRAVGRFATGVCVLSTRARGVDQAMTVNAFTSVSLEPMLVLVCVEQDSRFHDAVVEEGVWGVSVLNAAARPVAAWLSTRGRPLHGQLDRVPHHRGEATGVALVDQAVAWLECRTVQNVPAGDHTVLIGEVVSARTGNPEGGMLVYHRGRYERLG